MSAPDLAWVDEVIRSGLARIEQRGKAGAMPDRLRWAMHRGLLDGHRGPRAAGDGPDTAVNPQHPFRPATYVVAKGKRPPKLITTGGLKLKSVFISAGFKLYCHAAAAPRGIARYEEGGAGNRPMRKPAWSLQDLEIVEDLGLRFSGSSPVRSAN
jgi:hypothetical protein